MSDIGEIVVFFVAILSVPLFVSISRGSRGELSSDLKILFVWPVLVSAFFGYLNRPNFSLSYLFGGSMLGLMVSAGVVVWLDGKWQAKIDAKNEAERKDEEIRQLRKEIKEMQEK